MSSEENKTVARRVWEEIMNQGNMGRIEELFAPHVVAHDPGREYRGTEQLKQGVAYLRAAFPDLTYTVEAMLAEGDQVAVRYRGRGTQLGEFRGFPPTGKQINYTGIMIQRFEQGKLVEQWAEPDTLGLFQQLGIIPQLGQSG